MRFCLILVLLLPVNGSVLAAPQNIEVPKESWEPIFFSAINFVSQRNGLTPLRQMDIADGAIEIRVWAGFGLTPLRGVLLQRNGDKWSGRHVPGDDAHKLIPKASWVAIWKRVEALGILTLPDASILPNEVFVLDGMSYVVEINDGKLYRTYHYGNPEHQTWPEARRIIEIWEALQAE
jgi:hypothetical protein